MISMNLRQLEKHTTLFLEIITRAILSIVFLELEQTTPFIRKIQIDEIWLYKYPVTASYVPTKLLWPIVFLVPTTVIFLHFIWKKDKKELSQALLSLSLALALNGVVTNAIKITVGRPRPDFFYRCFPDGIVDDLEHVKDISEACKGQLSHILEGRKSFPSGHSSFSFCSLGFLSLWLSGKLAVFRGYRSRGWSLVVSGIPLMGALLIALSRTCDYHHHWQDVLVGSVIGFTIAYVCYRQYYPRLSSTYCHLPYYSIVGMRSQTSNGTSAESQDLEAQLDEQIKWI